MLLDHVCVSFTHQLCTNGWCPSIACMKGLQCDAGRLLIEWVDESQMACGHRHGVDQTGGDGTTGPARSPDRPRRSGRRPAENCLLRRPASRWCNLMSLRVPRTMLVYIEPNTSPSLWWTPAEACHAGPCKKLDVRRSCMCRHTRYRGTPPKNKGFKEERMTKVGFVCHRHIHDPGIQQEPLTFLSTCSITKEVCRIPKQASACKAPCHRIP